MKRVYCLYRVSTKGQVDGTDIPLQHIACHEYAKTHDDWEIINEFYEKGISGYKVSAEDRDAIQTIKADAAKGLFDVLLVYMFDRLGRKEDETPFIVQWFVSHGIEMWSTIEGQQKFDNHIDKLLNYIRFWQASGESEKTSIRIKTRLSQMVLEGLYRGGTPPFGYRLIENGRINKKGHPLHDIVKDDTLVTPVKELFKLMCYEGYGTHRLAKHFNLTYPKNSSPWRASTINRIICNPIYKGVVKYNNQLFQADSLRFVSDELYDQANFILHERGLKNARERLVPQQTNGSKLLTGLLYCAHCGERLAGTVARDKKILKKTGEIRSKERPIYRCFSHDRFLNKCEGKTVYSADRIDNAVLHVIMDIFSKIHAHPPEITLTSAYQNEIMTAKKRIEDFASEVARLEKQRRKLKDELLRSINGEAILDQRLLSELLVETEESLATAKQAIQEKQQAFDSIKEHQRTISEQQQKFLGWEAEFENASIAVKKMILSNIIRKIYVDKDYAIKVELNLTAKQFLEGI